MNDKPGQQPTLNTNRPEIMIGKDDDNTNHDIIKEGKVDQPDIGPQSLIGLLE